MLSELFVFYSCFSFVFFSDVRVLLKHQQHLLCKYLCNHSVSLEVIVCYIEEDYFILLVHISTILYIYIYLIVYCCLNKSLLFGLASLLLLELSWFSLLNSTYIIRKEILEKQLHLHCTESPLQPFSGLSCSAPPDF